MRRIGFDECDSTDEVCGWLNKIFANIDQMEAKIIQNAQEIEAMKKKKGKSKMKSKGSVLTRVMAFLMLVVVLAGLGYAAYVPSDINYDIASNPETLSRYLRDVTNNMRSDSYLFTPTATVDRPPAALGRIYYDSDTGEWVGYNAAGWTAFDVAAGASLDAAYGVGDTINVDGNTITFAAADVDDNAVLTVTQADTDNNDQAVIITHAGTGAAYISLDIDSQAGSRDIEGTGASWYTTGAGVIVGVSGDLTGAAGLTLQNDETITNADGKVTLTDVGGTANTLTFDLNHAATELELESNNIVTFDFGELDALTDVGTITFDASEIATITASGGAAEDFTIAYAGAADASLILDSDATGLDAIRFLTDNDGGIDIDADEDIAITVTSDAADEDLLLTQVGGQLSGIILTSSGIGASAIRMETTSATGNIWIDSGDDLVIDVAGLIDLDLVGVLDIDTDAAITIDNTAGDISIDSAAGSLNLTGAEAAEDAIVVTSGGGIDIAAVDDVDFILTSGAAGEDFTIRCAGAFDTTLGLYSSGTEANAIEIVTSAGGIDITNVASAAGEDVDISSNRAVNISSSEATDLAITLTTSNVAGNIRIQSADNSDNALFINTPAGGIDADSAGSIVVTSTEGGVDSVQLTSTGGGIDILAATDGDAEDVDLQVTGATNSSIDLYSEGTGADAIRIETTAGGIDIDIAGTAADEDFAITTDSSITFVTTEAVANQFFVDAQGAVAGFAINLGTTAAGITLDADGAADGDITLDAEDAITLTTIDENAGAIAMTVAAGGAAASTMVVTNTPGTDEASIEVTATAGGIDINANAGKNITIDAGQILIESQESAASAISLLTNTGILETIIVTNAAGTDDACIDIEATLGGIDIDSTKVINMQGDLAAASAIIINASAGGFDIDGTVHASTITQTATGAADDLTISQVGNTDSHLILESAGTSLDSIYIHEDGAGTGGGIQIHADTGTGVSATTTSVASIQLISDDGGIGLYSTANLEDTIRIEANGGVDETVEISSVLGTGPDSITLNSTVGGITVQTNAAGMDLALNSVLGSVNILAEELGAARAVSVVADGDATTGIWIQSVTSTSVTEDTAAIEIQATVGGIQIKSDANLDDAIVIRADGGDTAEILVVNDQGIAVDSVEIESLLGGITITGGADDNITLTTGTAGGAGNVVFTNGQTRAHYIYVDDVDLDVTNPPTLTSNGTDARWRSAVLTFDSNPGGNDDVCYIQWLVPAGYIADSADLHVYWSFSTAEDAGDECTIDGTVSAIGAGEDLDVAGTDMAAVESVITDASAEEGSLVKTSLDIEVEDIAVDDLVTIMFFFDEGVCEMTASGTADVHYFVITYESSE